MNIWIDQDLCTGSGLCEDAVPDVFAVLDDGLAYVRYEDKVMAAVVGNPQGAAGRVPVPERLHDLATQAAADCPGECIFIEPDH